MSVERIGAGKSRTYGRHPITSLLTHCRVSVSRHLSRPELIGVSVFGENETTTSHFVKLSRGQAEELRDRLSAALDDIEQGN